MTFSYRHNRPETQLYLIKRTWYLHLTQQSASYTCIIVIILSYCHNLPYVITIIYLLNLLSAYQSTICIIILTYLLSLFLTVTTDLKHNYLLPVEPAICISLINLHYYIDELTYLLSLPQHTSRHKYLLHVEPAICISLNNLYYYIDVLTINLSYCHNIRYVTTIFYLMNLLSASHSTICIYIFKYLISLFPTVTTILTWQSPFVWRLCTVLLTTVLSYFYNIPYNR